MDFWYGVMLGVWIGMGIMSLFQHNRERAKNKERLAKYIKFIFSLRRPATNEEISMMLAEALGVKRRSLIEVLEEAKRYIQKLWMSKRKERIL